MIDAGEGRVIVAAESIFAVQRFDDDAGVKKGGSEVPEGGGEFAGLCGMEVLACGHFRMGEGIKN